MSAQAISLVEWAHSFRHEIQTVCFDKEGAYRVRPQSIGRICDLINEFYHAAFAGDGNAVAELGELIRQVVGEEFIEAWEEPGRCFRSRLSGDCRRAAHPDGDR
jgi:hypothetical protein